MQGIYEEREVDIPYEIEKHGGMWAVEHYIRSVYGDGVEIIERPDLTRGITIRYKPTKLAPEY